MLVSIVIPCYNSERTIGTVVDTAIEVFKGIDGYECEFVLVNDFSKDDTFGAIRKLSEKYPNVKGINLAKNFGQHNAIMAALHYAEGDLIMGMDDDMQHHPDQIPLFLKKMEEGYDLVFGIYKKRKFNWMKDLFAKVNRVVMWKIIDRPKGIEMNSYWLAKKFVRDELIKFEGSDVYLQLLFFRTTHNIAEVEIEHHERTIGTSNYSFSKGLKVFMSSINYSVVPLRLATMFGGLFSAAGFLGAIIVLIRKLINPAIQAGWSSIMCAMLALFGIAFLFLGIIGEYIGKLILNSNRTPQFVVRETTNIDEIEE
ncbi:MAG: glycosyltransferase family 2 protein [Lachnospiraceae bacterium]|nr:glycosyltransferase family 2 protein [Candidatus Equihabitans merdae]